MSRHVFPRPCPSQTGTLTQNIMTFLKCSIRGVKYGEVTLEDVEREQVVSTGEFSDVTDEQLTAAGLVCPFVYVKAHGLSYGFSTQFMMLERQTMHVPYSLE